MCSVSTCPKKVINLMYRASSIAYIVSILVIINAKACQSEVESGNDVIEISVQPQIVKHEISGDSNVIKLKCSVLKNSFKKNRIMSINELKWEYKKCGYGLHLTNCANFPIIPWTPVMCKNYTKFCDSYTLKLEDPKTTDSGYYRCLYKNYMSKQFKVYKIFHLDIYDPEASFEIDDEPIQYDNQVIYANDTVTFRCRARSLFPLHMVWAKLLSDEQRINRPIQYGVNTYELINSGGSYHIGNDLYISKLTLSECQISDSGIYICIVISVNNAHIMKNKTVTLSVLPRVQNNSKNSVKSPFYIEFVLVLIFLLTSILT